MARFYFPINEKGFENIVSFSPLDIIICPRKPFGNVSAEEYLEFAKSDLKHGNKAGLVNALSNAKRCFHYQVDRLLYRYALREASSTNPSVLKSIKSEAGLHLLHARGDAQGHGGGALQHLHDPAHRDLHAHGVDRLSGQGPGVGAMSYHPVKDLVIMIHGPLTSTGLSYDQACRYGVMVSGSGKGMPTAALSRPLPSSVKTAVWEIFLVAS